MNKINEEMLRANFEEDSFIDSMAIFVFFDSKQSVTATRVENTNPIQLAAEAYEITKRVPDVIYLTQLCHNKAECITFNKGINYPTKYYSKKDIVTKLKNTLYHSNSSPNKTKTSCDIIDIIYKNDSKEANKILVEIYHSVFGENLFACDNGTFVEHSLGKEMR